MRTFRRAEGRDEACILESQLSLTHTTPSLPQTGSMPALLTSRPEVARAGLAWLCWNREGSQGTTDGNALPRYQRQMTAEQERGPGGLTQEAQGAG